LDHLALAKRARKDKLLFIESILIESILIIAIMCSTFTITALDENGMLQT